MPKLIIDGKTHDVKEGKNLLETILNLGYDLPYFCWHPAMGSVGSCRQCAIIKYKDEDDHKGKISMACMEPVKDGTRISLHDEQAHNFRQSVIEWLMTNHPHDCPVCDEGGECHLQDMTVMAGHAYRRFRYKKRTYNNQYLGPCINHEMNRCIQCYRCVRFYNDYAGGEDLNVFAAHNHVYFGRAEDGTLESEFSGNLVEVCPTGVFTDKTLKQHYTRKWDLTASPSICHGCSLGCNIIAGERYGSLRRVLSRYNGEVNGYFICDRGRFGYEYVNNEKRILSPQEKADESHKKITRQKALENAAGRIRKGKVIGIGSPRASLESNFALRTLVGEEHFYNGRSEKENRLLQLSLDIMRGPVRTASLRQIEKHDAVIIIGEDVTNTAPMIDLAVKQALQNQPKQKAKKIGLEDWQDAGIREVIQDERGPFYILTPQETKLDHYATRKFRAAPDDLARIAFAIANQLDENSPSLIDLDGVEAKTLKEIAETLKQAERPLVISGCSLGNENILKAAGNLARALHAANDKTSISLVVPEANSLGLAMMEPKSLAEAEKAAADHDTLIVLENDLFRRDSPEKIQIFLDNFKSLIVLDHLENATTAKADLLFPAGTFAEADGTLINNEGRAQRFFQVQEAEEDILESWRWLKEISDQAGMAEMKDWTKLDFFISAIEKELPVFNGISKAAPLSGFRKDGQKIAREPHRYSGRTAMYANEAVNEPLPPKDDDSPLSFTMEGYQGKPPGSATPFYWSPGWNSAQSINKFQIEVNGPLHGGDPGIRLIEPKEQKTEYFDDISEAFPKKNQWQLIPIHHIFGSEELSMHAPAIAQRTPGAFVILNPQDAENLNIDPQQQILLKANGLEVKLPVKTEKDWPQGTIGYPAGFPELPYLTAGSTTELKPTIE